MPPRRQTHSVPSTRPVQGVAAPGVGRRGPAGHLGCPAHLASPALGCHLMVTGRPHSSLTPPSATPSPIQTRSAAGRGAGRPRKLVRAPGMQPHTWDSQGTSLLTAGAGSPHTALTCCPGPPPEDTPKRNTQQPLECSRQGDPEACTHVLRAAGATLPGHPGGWLALGTPAAHRACPAQPQRARDDPDTHSACTHTHRDAHTGARQGLQPRTRSV